MKIKILGTGCPNCLQLEKNVREALKNSNKKAQIAKVTEIQEIMKYGVMSMPAIAINNKIKSYGRVNSVGEIMEMIEE